MFTVRRRTVDNATHYYADKTAEKVTEKISEKYNSIEKYMDENQLVINGVKSQLVVASKRGKAVESSKVFLKAGNTIIKPSISEKLLGATIDGTRGWRMMLRDGSTD